MEEATSLDVVISRIWARDWLVKYGIEPTKENIDAFVKRSSEVKEDHNCPTCGQSIEEI